MYQLQRRNTVLYQSGVFFRLLTSNDVHYGGHEVQFYPEDGSGCPVSVLFDRYPELVNYLFGYFDKTNPDYEEQLYVFMKRLHTQPSEFASMERGLRLRIYNRERELIEYERQQIEEMKNPDKK